MKIRFDRLALTSALICLALALVWSLAPHMLLSLWTVDFSEPVGLVCRRAAALFAGIGVMLFQLRHAAPSPVRSAVASGLIVACSLLALLGITELVLGNAGPGILLAVAVEIALAVGFRVANSRKQQGEATSFHVCPGRMVAGVVLSHARKGAFHGQIE